MKSRLLHRPIRSWLALDGWLWSAQTVDVRGGSRQPDNIVTVRVATRMVKFLNCVLHCNHPGFRIYLVQAETQTLYYTLDWDHNSGISRCQEKRMQTLQGKPSLKRSPDIVTRT